MGSRFETSVDKKFHCGDLYTYRIYTTSLIKHRLSIFRGEAAKLSKYELIFVIFSGDNFTANFDSISN